LNVPEVLPEHAETQKTTPTEGAGEVALPGEPGGPAEDSPEAIEAEERALMALDEEAATELINGANAAAVGGAAAAGAGVAEVAGAKGETGRLTLRERLEAFIARLSTRNNFWHRVCSLIWLPYAYRSGIRLVRRMDDNTFQAILPFRRFNRNWYNAMAGASLLANSEIAGGMYIFANTGGGYTLVCKHLEYSFLRPCFGPAVYKVQPREDIKALMASGKEFNITVDLDVIQQALVPEAIAKLRKHDRLLAKLASKERRVGKCVATFHLTPTTHQKAKRGSARKVG
jgi:hypothetical protein